MKADTRRRTRRRLLLAGLPLALVAVALQWKVAVMLLHDHDGRSYYADGAYGDARDAFASNASLNLVQAWVSPYDEGTARYRLADFKGAVRVLEDALSTAPPEEECRVRINLALAHEGVGDEAVGDDPRAAVTAWQVGLDVLQDGGCSVLREQSASDIGSSSLAEAADARTVDARLKDKLLANEPEDAPLAPAARERAERLEERNEQAKRDRRKMKDKKQDRLDAAANDLPPGTGEAPSYEW